MKLADLVAAGAVLGDGLVKKSITWTHTPPGKKKAVTDTFDVFIKRSSFGAMERLFAQDDDKKSQNARYLAESVRLGEGGEEEIPYETAFNLDPALGFLLLQAVAEVNGTAPGDEKLTPADEVWHELVLNGIGGCTIREAKERIDYDEYRAWVAYLKAWLPQRELSPGVGAGPIGGDPGQGWRGEVRARRLPPHVRAPVESVGISLEQAMAAWV